MHHVGDTFAFKLGRGLRWKVLKSKNLKDDFSENLRKFAFAKSLSSLK